MIDRELIKLWKFRGAIKGLIEYSLTVPLTPEYIINRLQELIKESEGI